MDLVAQYLGQTAPKAGDGFCLDRVVGNFRGLLRIDKCSPPPQRKIVVCLWFAFELRRTKGSLEKGHQVSLAKWWTSCGW